MIIKIKEVTSLKAKQVLNDIIEKAPTCTTVFTATDRRRKAPVNMILMLTDKQDYKITKWNVTDGIILSIYDAYEKVLEIPFHREDYAGIVIKELD